MWPELLAPLAPRLRSSFLRQQPLHVRGAQPVAKKAQEALQDLALFIDAGVLPAGAAEVVENSWRSRPLPGPTMETAASRTVYANNAGLYLPGLAEFCLAALKKLQWPTAANAYCSAGPMEVSVPPHTDRQDVVVFQATGHKRWSVFHPPPVGDADPLRRGKDGDALADLGEPLLDAVLEPGDILYVPLGFPHTTSTAALEPSTHITLNLDSVIWGLSYRLLWASSLRNFRLRSGQADEAEEATCTKGMSWARYSSLQSPLPLGFGAEVDEAFITSELLSRAEVWHGAQGLSEVPEQQDVREALDMILGHRQRVLILHQQMYADVMLGLSDKLPQEREADHWSALQAEMASLRTSLGLE